MDSIGVKDVIVVGVTNFSNGRANEFVVVKLGTAFLDALDVLVEAKYLVFKQPRIWATHHRVAEALDGVLHILRDELTLLAAKRRIVGKQNTGFDSEGETCATLLPLRDFFNDLRCKFYRARQPIVGQ